MKKIFSDKGMAIPACILAVIVIIALFAPAIAPYPPDELGSKSLQPPSLTHLLGTDDYGRDILSRAMYGARVSLSVGVIAVSISVLIGMMVGMLSGFYKGITDSLLMRIVDIMMAFPSIFLILAVQAALKPSIYNVMAVIGLTSWMGVARLFRSEVMSVSARPYVEAEKLIGLSDRLIMFRHVLPNAIAPVIVAATFGVAGAIMTESTLSFLGMGVQPPQASWGNMLQDSQYYLFDAPWLSLVPGILIFVTVLCVYFIGDGLRKYFNPGEDR